MNTEQGQMKMELRGDTEVVLTRTFAAPRQLVFDCHTKPELMRRWLVGPGGFTLVQCELDLRIGGSYLYVFSDAAGNKGGVYGKFRDVIVPEQLTNTENYAMDMSVFDPNNEDPNAMVESRTFTVQGNGTLLTHVCKYASAEARRMTIESGAGPDGMAASYTELDKLIQELG